MLLIKRFALAGFALLAATTIGLSAQVAAPALAQEKVFTIGAIPDQDPEKLQRLYGKVADYLSQALGVTVVYKPVQDYAASVTAFKVGDLQMVWFGGLTGTQARLQVEGAQAIIQRENDANFRTVFIASTDAGLTPLAYVEDLAGLKGKTFTFGSESSTSGRLMPQYFLQEAGLTLADFAGEVGFSGSHDATIKLVEAGTYEVGALNASVWKARVASKEVDTTLVDVIFETPPYFDYHWVIRPDVADAFGPDFTQKVIDAFLSLDPTVPEQKEILDLFSTNKFIETTNSNYEKIETIGREIGLIVTEAAPTMEPTMDATMEATMAATQSK
jgi:phosphonate transport system substrate-binding protein